MKVFIADETNNYNWLKGMGILLIFEFLKKGRLLVLKHSDWNIDTRLFIGHFLVVMVVSLRKKRQGKV